MERELDDLMSVDHRISVDTKHFFAIDTPRRIRRRLSISLTEHSYLPKADEHSTLISVGFPQGFRMPPAGRAGY